MTVPRRGLDLAEVARRIPRAVHVSEVDGGPEAVLQAEVAGAPDVEVLITEGGDAAGDLIGQLIQQLDVCRAHRSEIADGGVIGPLGVVDAAHDLRDQEVLVRIALTVGVGRAVHRHAVDEAREIGAVVEVETPDQVLVGLALARVDGDHQTRDGLVELADAGDGPELHLLLGDRALACGFRPAEEIQPGGGDHDFLDGVGAGLGVGWGGVR